MIHHAYTHYEPKDPEAARRQSVAQQTWGAQPWLSLPVRDADLKRMWSEKGRSFPYVKDLFDLACESVADNDIIVYTNADIMVRADCCARIAEALQMVDACYCYRRDFHHRVEKPIRDDEYVKGLPYAGSDLAAFRVLWWRTYRDDMPDMILAAEAWDPVIRQLIDETNPNHDGATRLHDVICHERHGSYWENPAHRYKLGMQTHNLTLAKLFFIQRGVNPAQLGIR